MIEQLAGRLLAAAARRWPEQLREELAREWAAELHTLRHEPGVPAPVRAWRQLHFAASLATARPAGNRGLTRVRLGGFEPAVLHGLALFLAPLAAVGLVTVAGTLTLTLAGAAVASVPTLIAPVWYAAQLAAQLAAAVLVGLILARRLRRRRSGRPVGVAGCLAATALLLAGIIPADILVRERASVDTGADLAAVGAGWLAGLLLPVVAVVVALARRHRVVAALVLAALAAPIVVLAATSLVVRHAGGTPARWSGGPWWWLAELRWADTMPFLPVADDNPSRIESILPLLPGVMLTTVVIALTYLIVQARSASPVPVTALAAAGMASREPVEQPARRTRPEVDRDPPPAVPDPFFHRALLAGAAFAVATWALTLTYLTPNIGAQVPWPISSEAGAPVAGWGVDWSGEDGRVWMQDLQLFAILCAGLCLLCAAAYRGVAVVPVLAWSVLLVATDIAVYRTGWTRVELLLPVLLAGAWVLAGVAWWAAIRLGPYAGRAPARHRRLILVATVLAAFLVPVTYLHRNVPPQGVPTPPVVLVVAIGLPAVLAMLVGCGVTATARRPPPGPVWVLPLHLGLITIIAGGLLFDRVTLPDPTSPVWEVPLMDALILGLPGALTLPLAVWAAGAIRRRRPTSVPRLGTAVILLPLLLVGGFVLFVGSLLVGLLLGPVVLPFMEYGDPYEEPYVLGAFLVGLLVARVAAIRLDRSDQPAEGSWQPGVAHL